MIPIAAPLGIRLLFVSSRHGVPNPQQKTKPFAQIEDLTPTIRVVYWNSRRFRLDILLALTALREAHKFRPDVILAENEAGGLALAFLKRLGVLSTKVAMYNHHPLSNGPYAIKERLTLFGRWD